MEEEKSLTKLVFVERLNHHRKKRSVLRLSNAKSKKNGAESVKSHRMTGIEDWHPLEESAARSHNAGINRPPRFAPEAGLRLVKQPTHVRGANEVEGVACGHFCGNSKVGVIKSDGSEKERMAASSA